LDVAEILDTDGHSGPAAQIGIEKSNEESLLIDTVKKPKLFRILKDWTRYLNQAILYIKFVQGQFHRRI
jgi:hypothetical protein